MSYDVIDWILYIFYGILHQLLLRFHPRKGFNLKADDLLGGISITEDERDADRLKPNETLIFEGSSADGTSIYIEVSTLNNNYHVANVVFTHDSNVYINQFEGYSEDNIICGPLTVEMREPLRKWRISFRGHLISQQDNKEIFLTMGGWFKALSNARYFYSNSSLKTFMSIIRHQPLKLINNINMINRLTNSDDIHQFGQFHVEVNYGEFHEKLRLRGVRRKFLNDKSEVSDEFHVYLDDGNKVSIVNKTSEQYAHLPLVHGFISRADHRVRAVRLVDEQALDMDNHRMIQLQMKTFPDFGLRKEEVIGSCKYINGRGQEVEIKRVKVVSVLSRGLALYRSVNNSTHKAMEPPPRLEEYTATSAEKKHRVLKFTHKACQDKQLTGGKGANLAKLTSIENKYVVPSGVVVTVAAFQEHIKNNAQVGQLVKSLENTELSLEEQLKIGESIQSALQESIISTDLLDELAELNVIRQDAKYAVRSSAVGEDGSDLSSAGQLESSLNVHPEEISKKIIECWCSNFRRECISYRRTYGQLVSPPMAVVIQEMVVNGVAGVMFTCDPVRNDDSKMVINAIKGLGEDIVSGVVTPDEIICDKRSHKSHMEPDPCCLDAESLQNLIRTGLYLEDRFQKAQDIEFVVKDRKVHIVQSRDVTGRDQECQFELETEFDSATITDKEVVSTANVGEVAPYPLTPAELDTFFDIYDKAMATLSIQETNTYKNRHVPMVFASFSGRYLMNFGEMFLRQWRSFIKDRLAEISIAGMEIFTPEMFEMGQLRYGAQPFYFQMWRLLKILYIMFVTGPKILLSIAKKTEEHVEMTPKEGQMYSVDRLLDIYQRQRLSYITIISDHGTASTVSSFTYIIVGMLIRGSEEGGMSDEMLTDFANVFSNASNVISADVPVALKKIAQAIKADGLEQQFKEANTKEEAIKIIQNHGTESKKELQAFLDIHGHRGNRELYLKGTSWGEDVKSIVPNLNIILQTDEEEIKKDEKSIDEMIDSLKCKPEGVRRKLMKYMVEKTRAGVAARETAKSHLVRATYEMRQTFKWISRAFCKEGLLREEDLCFYLTIDELKELYHTRSPRLVSRAHRRRKVFATFEGKRLEHIYYGNAYEVQPDTTTDYSSTISLRGTVVCEGVVRATARVAKNLEEAKKTQPGEILITRCTDICWSPYFPILKGIVTEIGGLLSHGAVVAREYGLPSLIAVEHATDVFKTGDFVELNTNTSTISKIEKSQ